MKIKTSEMTGTALDWAVAKCEGIDDLLFICHEVGRFRYSTDWSQGGPIIERGLIDVWVTGVGRWSARRNDPAKLVCVGDELVGTTPLIAAMRCFVASKLGDEVDVPEELA